MNRFSHNIIPYLKTIATALIIAILPMAAHAGTLAEQGDSAYNKKNFTEALSLYRQALEKDGTSSKLYYNIGNTYYRLNDPGHAVINYERALNIDPSNEDARTNLEYVNSKIMDKPEDDSTFLSNIHHRMIASMSPDAWAWFAFAMFVVMVAALALYMFSSNITARKVGFFGAFVLLAVFAYTLVVAISAASRYDSHEYAVVTAPTTNLRSTPSSSNSRNDKVVPIHVGTKVQILDSIPTPDDPSTRMWYDVKINNTSRAWVSAADVERI